MRREEQNRHQNRHHGPVYGDEHAPVDPVVDHRYGDEGHQGYAAEHQLPSHRGGRVARLGLQPYIGGRVDHERSEGHQTGHQHEHDDIRSRLGAVPEEPPHPVERASGYRHRCPRRVL